MRTINNIFVHCTATQPSATIEALRNGFRARGWHAPGYHYVIEADGTLRRLWAEEHVANGVQGYNQHAIHVAYIGGIDTEGAPAPSAPRSKLSSASSTGTTPPPASVATAR